MVPPNNQCLNALLKLTCSKCQKSIPMLCRNVCGAVAKGCYAPYAAVLNPQFNILWNVSSQLAQALVSALSDLFMQQGKIRKALVRKKGAFGGREGMRGREGGRDTGMCLILLSI